MSKLNFFLASLIISFSHCAIAGTYEKIVPGAEYGVELNKNGSMIGIINKSKVTLTVAAKDIVIITQDGNSSPCMLIQPVIQTFSGTSGTPVPEITVKPGGKGLFPLVGCGTPNSGFVVSGKPISIKVGKYFILGPTHN